MANFIIVKKTKHFRACSTTCVKRNPRIKKDIFFNRPLKESISIEQKVIERSLLDENKKENYYIVIAFLKWDKKNKKAVLLPVGERLRSAKGFILNIPKRIELNNCIKEAKKRMYAENNKGDK